MKKLIFPILAILAIIFGLSCHQCGVWLKDPVKYDGNLADPTITLNSKQSHILDCNTAYCNLSVTVKPVVINPTSYSIFPYITCEYYLDDWNAGKRNIKEFEVPARSKRQVLIDNMLQVEGNRITKLTVTCDMDLSLFGQKKRFTKKAVGIHTIIARNPLWKTTNEDTTDPSSDFSFYK